MQTIRGGGGRPVPRRSRTWAIAAAVVLLLGGCGAGNGDSELVDGTVENRVAGSLDEGTDSRKAQDALPGESLESVPYAGGVRGGTCELYRGVNLRGEASIEATGTVWRICFRRGQVARVTADCPVPWREGERGRYEAAGYTLAPKACA